MKILRMKKKMLMIGKRKKNNEKKNLDGRKHLLVYEYFDEQCEQVSYDINIGQK